MDEKCCCGNPKYGFGCSCKHKKENPGEAIFICEYCGIFKASKPKCNKCEKEN